MNQTTVYILDDEPALLKLLSEVVEQIGLNVQSYSRASSFFKQFPLAMTNSILVLDLQMPEMDGIEVMRRLAAVANHPALSLVSGHDVRVLHAAEKLGRAQNLKILASLSKPLALDQFRQLLKRYALTDDAEHKGNDRLVEYDLGAD